MEDSKLPTLLIIAAGLVVGFLMWKRSKDPAAAAAPGFSGIGDAVRTVNDPPVSDRGPTPGFGGGVDRATGGASTARAPVPVNAPVGRGTPPPPSAATQPTRDIYVKPGSTVASGSALFLAHLSPAAHL